MAVAAELVASAARNFSRTVENVENENATFLELRKRLDMSTEYFLVPTTSTLSTVSSSSSTVINPGIITKSVLEEESVFRNEVWVMPVIALAGICMALIAGFEVFVVCKAWRTTPSRRHLFLGQMLLLGLFGCAGIAAVLTLSPTPNICAVVRLGSGVSCAVVFAALLVKCVFLISLNGGVYLPAPYQALLLFFAVLTQIAIGGQWLITNPANISTHQSVLLCRAPYFDTLSSFCYIFFLIIFVALLAIKSRTIRDNYREATYIGLSIGATIPIWLIWILSGLIISERNRDACLAFGLIATSGIIFLVMFMPKGRQLAAMGKDGVFLEDREDRFSSLSRAGSGYSPSFFHFKPVKFNHNYSGSKQHAQPATITTLGAGGVFLRPDDGNVYTTLEPTLSSNPNVYFQRGNGMHPGMMY